MDSLNNLIDIIPSILERSGTLFGFFALLVLAVAFLSYVFYIKADKTDRNRAFRFTLLFFFGLVIAALAAGVLSGFRQGSEATLDQVAKNPGEVDASLVRLPPEAMQQLEAYIAEQGEAATAAVKARVLAEALERYINPPAIPVPGSELSSSPQPAPVGSNLRVKTADFLFVLERCVEDLQAISCWFKVTNQGEDRRELDLYADYGSSYQSVLFDGSTRLVASEVKLGDRSRSSAVELEMPFNISVDAQFTFSKGSLREIEVIQAIDLTAYADGQKFQIKFEAVPLSSEEL